MPVFNIANDVHHFRHTGFWPAFVDNGQIGFEATRQRPGAHNATNIRRHKHQFRAVITRFDVAYKNRRGKEIIGWYIKEPLNLSGVQINCQHPVGRG